MRPVKFFLSFIACLIALTGFSAAPLPAAMSGSLRMPLRQTDQGGQYFPETGHWVRGPYYEKYISMDDAALFLGSPITEVLDHPISQGVKVQYFERGRLEYDASAPAGQQVTVAELGDWLYANSKHGSPADFPTSSGACRTFPPNNMPVCYSFLEFYLAHNGSVTLGAAISPTEVIDGRLVQYFKLGRMEWRPEMPAGQRVILTDIGRIYFQHVINDPSQLWRLNAPQAALTEIQVDVFPAFRMLPPNGQQSITVLARDSALQPVAGALVKITITKPNGQTEIYRANAPTNADGMAMMDFSITDVVPTDLVNVRADVNIPQGPAASNTTWFRIWW